MRYIKALFLIFVCIQCSEKENDAVNTNFTSDNNPSSNAFFVTTDATYDVMLTEDIVYAEGLSHETLNSSNYTTVELKLDVYRPVNNHIKRPALVLFHGGGFLVGSKKDEDIVSFANTFASKGWVVFCANYRLGAQQGTIPENWVTYAQNNLDINQRNRLYRLYPAQRDAKSVIRWIVGNASRYNVDANYITVGGGSAGAALANGLGITEPEDYTQEISIATDPTLESTFLSENSTVKTILNFWGGAYSVDLLENIYGYQRFDSNDAPILIVHGTEDSAVAIRNSEELRDAYIESGGAFEFIELEGAGHSAWNATYNGNTLDQIAFDFIVSQQNIPTR